MKNRTFWLCTGMYLVFLSMVLPVTWTWLRYGCLPAYDLGIFSETLIAGWSFRWDPFLTTRESFMLQDHWDPVTLLLGYVTSPFSSLLSAPVFLLWFEATMVFLSALSLRLALLRRGFDESRAWLAFASIIFASVTWNALHFPVHPTTWALWPHLLLIFWYFDFFHGPRKRELLIYAALGLWIWMMGEAFALAFATAHLALLVLAPRRRLDLALLALPVLIGAWWAVQGRIWVHGSMYNHAARVTFDWVQIIQKYEFDADFFRRFFGAALVFLAPLTLLGLEIKRLCSSPNLKSLIQESRVLVVCMGFAAPLVLGRLLSNSWKFHYGILMCAVFAAGFLFLKDLRWSRRSVVLFLALSALSSLGDWAKAVPMAFNPALGCSAVTSTPTAPQLDSRRKDIETVVQMLPTGARVMTGFYLVATLLGERPDLIVHTLGPFQQSAGTPAFDYLWLPKAPFDNHWPLSPGQVEQILASFKGERTELSTSLLVKGPIRSDFFNLYQGPQSLIFTK